MILVGGLACGKRLVISDKRKINKLIVGVIPPAKQEWLQRICYGVICSSITNQLDEDSQRRLLLSNPLARCLDRQKTPVVHRNRKDAPKLIESP